MNSNKVTRILYIGISPIQNTKPYRLLQKKPDFVGTVVYLKKPVANTKQDKESITKAAFDTDLLSGYNNHFLKTFSITGKGFFSAVAPEVVKWVWKHDLIVVYGHNYFTFWLAMIAAKLFRKKLIQTTDAIYMEATAESGGWKMKLKPVFLRSLYNNFVNGVFVTSTASKLFLQSVGIRPEKMAVIPYAVDEDMIQRASEGTDIKKLKSELHIPLTDTVFVFCAKFIPRKRPLDAIEAFAGINNHSATLLMIGDGPMMQELKQRANDLHLRSKIIFTGLVNYSKLPSYYTAADALVFCSEHEPYGLPVNEAMLCGRPVIVSDRIGARLDLVEEGKTGWIYRTGDVQQLSELLEKVIAYKADGRLQKMGQEAKMKMQTWSSETNLNNQLEFFRSKNWIKGQC
jgi:glycosyltransferase involved in cell wall biosynthesis